MVVASGCAAIVSLMLALGDETRLRGMLFWLMGDLSFAPFSPAALCLLLVVGGLAVAGARTLNVLARGEIESQALGVALSPARIALFCATAALTAAAVITAGGIGFIGLVTPHLVRLAAGSNHRIVVPASILLGGTLLTLADTLARIAAAPRQLPVGALTALIGVPLFLMLMRANGASPHSALLIAHRFTALCFAAGATLPAIRRRRPQPLLTLGRPREQFQHGGIQFDRNGQQRQNGDVVRTALESSDHIRMNPRLMRQRLLAQVALLAAFPNFFTQASKDRSRAHATRFDPHPDSSRHYNVNSIPYDDLGRSCKAACACISPDSILEQNSVQTL